MNAEQLFEAAEAIRMSELRGDFMIGLRPLADLDEMEQLYSDALAAGGREMALRIASTWMYDEAHDRAEQAHALVEPLLGDDPDGSAHVLAGYMALRGFGFGEDPVESRRLHAIAAERGNPAGMFEMYVLLSSGTGGPRDDAEAQRWCIAAAEAGSARAVYNLGAFHASGRGFPRDLAKALAYYRQAADLGNGQAAATAGIMTLRGDVGQPSVDEARALLDRAEALGFDVGSLLERVGLERPR